MAQQHSYLSDASDVVCMSIGRDAFKLLHETVQHSQLSITEVLNFSDTFAARERLHAIALESREENRYTTANVTPSALVVVIDYNPEEIWSLTTMMTQLLDLEPLTKAHVVLVIEGWLWALPVFVTDFPRLTTILKGAQGRRALSGILSTTLQDPAVAAPMPLKLRQIA
jgi:hypothetical protein